MISLSILQFKSSDYSNSLTIKLKVYYYILKINCNNSIIMSCEFDFSAE